MNYQTYPNRIGHKPNDGQHGVIRTGIVEENEETKRGGLPVQARQTGLAGCFAAVTHETDGTVRFYIFTATSKDSKYPNNPLWVGPYTGLSEEITDIKEKQPARLSAEAQADDLAGGSAQSEPLGTSLENESLKPFEDWMNQEEGPR